jgi:succinoglycan biosynthesis transport protein ExoP
MTAKPKPVFSPLSIARMVWKRKLLIGVTSAVCCTIAILIVMRLPAVYQAEASILVDSQKIPEQYVTSTVNTNVQDRLATISQQILSATRLQKVIDNFGLYEKERKSMGQEEIIELMRKDISIKLEKGWTGGQPGAFRVGYQGPSASMVADVANQLGNLFIEENLRTRERQAEGTADFIDSELASAKKTLEDEESKLSKYKVQHNGELPQQEESIGQTLSRLQVELGGNEDAINRAHQNKTTLQTALTIAEAEVSALSRPPIERAAAGYAPSGEISAPAARKPLKKSEVMQQTYDAAAMRYGANHPDMVSMREQIELQKKIEASEEGASAAVAKSPETKRSAQPQPAGPEPLAPPSRELIQARSRVETIRSQLANADQEIATRNAERQQVLHNISLYQARMERLPLREQELAQVTRDYEISKANYKSLLDRKLAAGMATDMEHRQQAERFTLLDPARTPDKPTKPNRPAFIGLGCLVSLGLAFGIGIGREAKTNAILGEWEIAADMPILGRVPVIKPMSKDGSDSSWPKGRTALLSSAILLILAIGAAAGAHFYLGWF